jgi:beta-glucosidase
MENLQQLVLISSMLFFSWPSMSQEPIFPDKYDGQIKQIMSRMTLEEKVFQLHTEYPNANSRLGIPHLSANECLHGARGKGATVFPQAIAMGSTWDVDLIERMGAVVAKEARAFGIHHCFAPMLAVVRDIRWGRTEESYGEDPFLVGCVGAAYIHGLQGRGAERFDKDHIIATAKHFVADGEPMAGDNGAAMDVSDYTLHNVHLYPFRMAIEEAGVGSIMPAHHLLNGIPCHGNHHILEDILCTQYMWDGLVVSDNNDIRAMTTTFNYTPDFVSAARKALEVGIHQELCVGQGWNATRMYGENLILGVQSGLIPETLVDSSVFRVLKAKFALRLFETESLKDDMFDMVKHPENRPYGSLSPEDAENYEKATFTGLARTDLETVINDEQHRALALEVAHKSIVLLKNEGGLLPLNLEKYKKIAVIGPNAVEMRLGGYSPKPEYYISVYDGIKKYTGTRAQVSFAKGCEIASESAAMIPEAVDLAQQSEICILVLGGSEETCLENVDIDQLDLTGKQLELVRAVYNTGKPCVVILLNGRPNSIPWMAENIPAIMEGWYLGQETGTALADVIFGKFNPSGKLPFTFPRDVGQVPSFYNKLPTGRPRRLFQSSAEPLFSFGHGLSYATFELGQPWLENDTIPLGASTKLNLTVTNTGQMDGDEIMQLYIHDLISNRVRPVKELRGFQKVTLQKGERKTISFEIGKKQLEYWDGEWLVEFGDFEIMVGPNSVDLKKIKLVVE